MKLKSTRSKIVTKSEAKKIASSLHRKGKKIVFTNGCFDLLHIGHVTYLEKAARLGDVLFVGIDTDSAVRGQKGPTRPINPLRARSGVLAGLEAVTYVVSFSKSNPISLIEAIKPDVLVKGGDWKASQILGAKEVLGSGGKVKSIPIVAGFSTTRLISKSQGKK